MSTWSGALRHQSTACATSSAWSAFIAAYLAAADMRRKRVSARGLLRPNPNGELYNAVCMMTILGVGRRGQGCRLRQGLVRL